MLASGNDQRTSVHTSDLIYSDLILGNVYLLSRVVVSPACLHTSPYFCLLLLTSAYFCLLLLTSPYFCLLLLSSTHFSLLLLTSPYFYLLLLTSTYFYLLLLTSTYFCLFLLTSAYLLLLTFPYFSLLLLTSTYFYLLLLTSAYFLRRRRLGRHGRGVSVDPAVRAVQVRGRVKPRLRARVTRPPAAGRFGAQATRHHGREQGAGRGAVDRELVG